MYTDDQTAKSTNTSIQTLTCLSSFLLLKTPNTHVALSKRERITHRQALPHHMHQIEQVYNSVQNIASIHTLATHTLWSRSTITIGKAGVTLI